MDSTSWPLRIALLVIGLTVLGGIYLWSAWRRRRESSQRYARGMRGLRTPPMPRERDGMDSSADEPLEFPPTPEDDYEIVVVKPREQRESPAELPKIRREPDPPPAVAQPMPQEVEAAQRPARKRKTNQLDFGFNEDVPANTPERRPPARPRPAPDVLALYLRPARTAFFSGPDLVKAFSAVGMRYGDMNIYHHFGAGDLRSETPLFSLANMFEPGQFELTEIEQFQTAGLVLFIQFPAPLDGPVAFELFLNTAQRLAETLDADLLSEPKKALDSASIENMRSVAARHSDEHT